MMANTVQREEIEPIADSEIDTARLRALEVDFSHTTFDQASLRKTVLKKNQATEHVANICLCTLLRGLNTNKAMKRMLPESRLKLETAMQVLEVKSRVEDRDRDKDQVTVGRLINSFPEISCLLLLSKKVLPKHETEFPELPSCYKFSAGIQMMRNCSQAHVDMWYQWQRLFYQGISPRRGQDFEDFYQRQKNFSEMIFRQEDPPKMKKLYRGIYFCNLIRARIEDLTTTNIRKLGGMTLTSIQSLTTNTMRSILKVIDEKIAANPAVDSSDEYDFVDEVVRVVTRIRNGN